MKSAQDTVNKAPAVKRKNRPFICRNSSIPDKPRKSPISPDPTRQTTSTHLSITKMKHWRPNFIIATFLAITALLHHQYRENNRLEKVAQFADLTSPTPRKTGSNSPSGRNFSTAPSSSTSSRIAHLKQLANSPLDVQTLLSIFERGQEQLRNSETWHENYFALMNLNATEIAALRKALLNHDLPAPFRTKIRDDLARLFPEDSPFETRIQNALKEPTNSHVSIFKEWLASDLEAARIWLTHQIENGTITEKGLRSDPLTPLLQSLATRLIIEEHPEANTFYEQIPDSRKHRVQSDVTREISKGRED